MQVAPLPAPPECPPPADPQLRREVDSLAALAARSGPAVEQVARKQAAAALSAGVGVLCVGEVGRELLCRGVNVE